MSNGKIKGDYMIIDPKAKVYVVRVNGVTQIFPMPPSSKALNYQAITPSNPMMNNKTNQKVGWSGNWSGNGWGSGSGSGYY